MQNVLKKTDKFFLFFICAVFPFCVIAHPAVFDTNQPITIQSDNASIEQLTHTATYSGNVVMVQGVHKMHADKLVIRRCPKQNETVFTATGHPASFTGKRANDPSPLFATAQTIYYYPSKQTVVLEGSATLEHQKDTFQGPSLSYNLEKQIISSSSQSNERPTVTLYPKG